MIKHSSIEELIEKTKDELSSLMVANSEENINYIYEKDWGQQLNAKRAALKLYDTNDYNINNGYDCAFFDNDLQIGIQFKFHEPHTVFNPFFYALKTMISDFNSSFETIMFKIEKDQLEDYILTIFCIGDKLEMLKNKLIFKTE